MKRLNLFILVISLSVSLLCGQNSTVGNAFLTKFEQEIESFNKRLPMQQFEGLWIWSANYSNKVFTTTYKMNSFYQMLNEDVLDKMPEEFVKGVLMGYGDIATEMGKNGITMKLIYKSYEDNKIFKVITVNPQMILKYCNELKNSKVDIGNRPLSYYQKGFTSDSSELPRQLDEYTIYNKVSMPDRTVFYDYLLDDTFAELLLSNKEAIEEMRKEVIRNFLNMISTKEFKEDLVTYKITMRFRYYYKSTKKLAFQYSINPLTDF